MRGLFLIAILMSMLAVSYLYMQDSERAVKAESTAGQQVDQVRREVDDYTSKQVDRIRQYAQ